VLVLNLADDDGGVFRYRAHGVLRGAVQLGDKRAELLGGPAPGDGNFDKRHISSS
jgi:hypothetical protein